MRLAIDYDHRLEVTMTNRRFHPRAPGAAKIVRTAAIALAIVGCNGAVVATDAGDAADIATSFGCQGVGSVFPSFSSACASDSDCIVAYHQIDCCGTRIAHAINPSQQSEFDSEERACDAIWGECGCNSALVIAQTGVEIVPAGAAPVAACVNGSCVAQNPSPGACGTMTCSAGQVCLTICGGGDASNVPRCVDVPPACDSAYIGCSCLGVERCTSTVSNPCPLSLMTQCGCS